MVEWYRQDNTPDTSIRGLWQSNQQYLLVGKQEELAKEMNLALRSTSFILLTDL
jgi:hypothetical protein